MDRFPQRIEAWTRRAASNEEEAAQFRHKVRSGS